MCWHNGSMAVARRRRLSRISINKHLHGASTAPLLSFLPLQSVFNRARTYPPSWRWHSCVRRFLLSHEIMEAGAGGGHKHTTTHADADAPSRAALTQQTSLSSLFDKVILQRLPLTKIHPNTHYCEREDTHEHRSPPGLTSPRHSSPLYSALFTSVPSSFFLPSPSPVLSYSQLGLLPSSPTLPFLLLVAALADWLTMPLQVNAGNEAKGRACTDLKREGQFTLQADISCIHACLHAYNNKKKLLNPPSTPPKKYLKRHNVCLLNIIRYYISSKWIMSRNKNKSDIGNVQKSSCETTVGMNEVKRAQMTNNATQLSIFEELFSFY